jgi:hypothetical protein
MEVRLVGASLPDDVFSRLDREWPCAKVQSASRSNTFFNRVGRRLPIRRKTVISFRTIGDCLKVILRCHIFMMRWHQSSEWSLLRFPLGLPVGPTTI